MREEAFDATALLQKLSNPNLHDVSMPAHNRLVCIGGVKLAGFDRVSFDAIIHANHHVN